MIHFMTVLVFTLSAYAQTVRFSLERSTPRGHDKFEIIQTAKKTTVHKTSNWFDSGTDTRLGTFHVTNPGLLGPILPELREIHSEIWAADNRLKTMGSSFDELNSTKAPHAPYFRLNGYRVQVGSLLYPRLEKLAARLQALQLVLDDGVELDKDRKHYIFFRSGKEIKREEFSARFFCDSPNFPARCLAREWGALYLE